MPLGSLDNSGNTSLRVPGFNGVDIHHQEPWQQSFAYGRHWSQVPAVTAREYIMVETMELLTDEPDWHTRIFSDDDVAEWREEYKHELMSDKAWAWCIAEVKDKATDFNNCGFVRVLDTGSCVIKVDSLPVDALGGDLRLAMAILYDQRRAGSTQKHLIVDPHMYPLVYGRSQVLTSGQVIARPASYSHPAFTWTNTTFPAPDQHACKHGDLTKEEEHAWRQQYHFVAECAIKHQASRRDKATMPADLEPHDYLWSSKFQALPCEVEFTSGTGHEVRIISYINNLHPDHEAVYRCVEELISLSIEPWNQCLIRRPRLPGDNDQIQRGRVPLRIVTFGAQWRNQLPTWAASFCKRRQDHIRWHQQEEAVEAAFNDDYPDWRKKVPCDIPAHTRPWLKGATLIPDPTEETWHKAKQYLELPEPGSQEPVILPIDWQHRVWELIMKKTKRRRHWRHPEPALRYGEWKSSSKVTPVVNMIKQPLYCDDLPTAGPDFELYEVHLEEEFRQQGLQVIVKITNIELTSEKPVYHSDNWQMVGCMNEHVVATTMYAYDVSNVTPCRVRFRQETPMPPRVYRYQADKPVVCSEDDPSRYRWDPREHREELTALGGVFGMSAADLRDGGLPIRETGSVNLSQGRLIAFPNVLEYSLTGFQLKDPSQPGHLRYITLHLVDPHYRLCSTRNVPPQQHEWWSDLVIPLLMRKRLPYEIAETITQLSHWQLGEDDAIVIKAEMDKEQRWCQLARYAEMKGYRFDGCC